MKQVNVIIYKNNFIKYYLPSRWNVQLLLPIKVMIPGGICTLESYKQALPGHIIKSERTKSSLVKASLL